MSRALAIQASQVAPTMGEDKPASSPGTAVPLASEPVSNSFRVLRKPDTVPGPELERVPLPCDVFGLFFLRLTQLAGRNDEVKGLNPVRMPFLRFASALLLYVLYLILTAGVLIFLLIVVTESKSAWSRKGFMAAHGVTRDEAAGILLKHCGDDVSADRHQHIPDKFVGTCQAAGQVPHYIYSLIIFLWTIRMFVEFKSARDWARDLFLLEKRIEPGASLMTATGAKSTICLTERWIVSLCFVLIVVVKLVVFALTLHIGAWFLMLQNEGFAIVVKSVAMQIVLGISAQIAASLALHRAIVELQGSSFSLKRSGDQCLEKIEWYDGVGSIVLSFCAALVTFYYVYIKFGDLVHLRYACRCYLGDADVFNVWTVMRMSMRDLEP